MAKLKLKVGDVFSIPLGNGELGFGQIVSLPDRDTLIIALFNFKQNDAEPIDINKIFNSEVLFLGYTLDAKLYHKHWVIIGNIQSNLSNIKLPYSKLGTPPGDIYLTDFKGAELCEITEIDFSKLSYQTVIAPIRYENALKAYFKLGEWQDDYDKLFYKHTLTSNNIADWIMSIDRTILNKKGR